MMTSVPTNVCYPRPLMKEEALVKKNIPQKSQVQAQAKRNQKLKQKRKRRTKNNQRKPFLIEATQKVTKAKLMTVLSLRMSHRCQSYKQSAEELNLINN